MFTSATSLPVNTSSPFALWKIDHVAVRVPDYETAIAWYTKALDFRLKYDLPLAGLRFAFLSPPDDSFVVELMAGPGFEEPATYSDLHDSYRIVRWHHISFRVESVDDAIDELKRRDVTIVSEPHDVPPLGLRLAFFADPWGNLFELIQPLSNG